MLFESPVRLAATLEELANACGGDRTAVVARELTKKFEQVEVFRLADRQEVAIPAKGEVTLAVEGRPGEESGQGELEQWLKFVVQLRAAGISNRDILRTMKVLAPEILPSIRGRVLSEDER